MCLITGYTALVKIRSFKQCIIEFSPTYVSIYIYIKFIVETIKFLKNKAMKGVFSSSISEIVRTEVTDKYNKNT